MLNPFPELLVYGFFAPTLLRIAAALVFVYVAWVQISRRDEIALIRYPLIGGGMWTVWLSVAWEGVVAGGLFLGYYTQIAAIIGLLAAAKYFIWKRRWPAPIPISRIASVLLFVILLSLLLSGAGALAFDLPL